MEKLDLNLPDLLDHSERPKPLLAGWLAIEVVFKLRTPWYSKDDRPFHVRDNPVRKDRVFDLPFMSAASWKGLLRWACRMEDGLLEHLAEHEGGLDGWKEPSWILHLFGNGKEEDEIFSRGALHCFPTWFNKIGFEVINPHDRARRAGTQPILYEVVPASTSGTLSLLYAPMPGQARRQGVVPTEVLDRLLPALEKLLTRYGFSAKRTAGWGVAGIQARKLCTKGSGWKEAKTLAEAKTLLAKLLGEGKGKQ
ncbi:RAMP superfamily CRISPR-associated protein [Methylacidimicrobium sp. AP8]|uniref:RAMP superfamily CRISPR-associated protein n=1 Tax=Methylacidimicrobium sp. AP8 TaxID=2730359 RepID=UPI0019210DE7|nr:RAMP superfamily CRISPR-associated protein [Methylacidimicrobium sp. AP8]